jgi:transposase-like protein
LTNLLECLNKEGKRRTNVVEKFPDVPVVLRQLYEADLNDMTEPTPLKLAPAR